MLPYGYAQAPRIQQAHRHAHGPSFPGGNVHSGPYLVPDAAEMDELECKQHVAFMHNLVSYMHKRLNDIEANMCGEIQALRREIDSLRHSLRVQQFSRDSSAPPAQL